jgi:hypothetical protein
MIYKYNFSISGDDFYPEQIFNSIQGDFEINSYFNPKTLIVNAKSGEYGYGNLAFWHPKKFATEDDILEYEKDFVEFIEKNYSLFIDNGVNEFEMFIEIYFDGGQCNFELFNKDFFKKVAKIGVSIPVSIYVLSTDDIQKWENEIRLNWNDCK